MIYKYKKINKKNIINLQKRNFVFFFKAAFILKFKVIKNKVLNVDIITEAHNVFFGYFHTYGINSEYLFKLQEDKFSLLAEIIKLKKNQIIILKNNDDIRQMCQNQAESLDLLNGEFDCLLFASLNAIIITSKVLLENSSHLTFNSLNQDNFFTAMDAVRELKSFSPEYMHEPLQDFFNTIQELETRKRLEAYVRAAQGVY